MISHRNIDPNNEYELKSRYAGGGKKELKKSKAETVEAAVERTVKDIPGGEFLLNVKLYEVKRKYYAVEGDVWGPIDDHRTRGFSLGDRVICKEQNFLKTLDLKGDIIYGKITGFINGDEVFIKVEGEENRTIKVPIDKLTKSK